MTHLGSGKAIRIATGKKVYNRGVKQLLNLLICLIAAGQVFGHVENYLTSQCLIAVYVGHQLDHGTQQVTIIADIGCIQCQCVHGTILLGSTNGIGLGQRWIILAQTFEEFANLIITQIMWIL